MDAFIVMPFSRFGGALAGVHADDLAAVPIRGYDAQSRHQSCSIDKSIGCANRAGEDNRQFSGIGGTI